MFLAFERQIGRGRATAQRVLQALMQRTGRIVSSYSVPSLGVSLAGVQSPTICIRAAAEIIPPEPESQDNACVGIVPPSSLESYLLLSSIFLAANHCGVSG